MALSDRIPGMKSGHRWRNVGVGVVYFFVIMAVLSAVVPSNDNDIETTAATNPTATPDGGQQVAPGKDTPASMATSKPTPMPTETEAKATPTVTSALTPAPEPAAIAEPVNEPAPKEFSGSGATVTDRFTLAGGFTAFEYVHTGGSSNFAIWLRDPTGGERDRLIANEIGETKGGYAEGIPEGEYVLDVQADGDWEVVVEQPRVAPGGGQDAPVKLSGDASDGYWAINLEGLTQVTATHEGEGNFVVWSYDRHGGTHLNSLMFNEIGRFEGETSVRFEGTSWIVVKADGPWTLSFEPV